MSSHITVPILLRSVYLWPVKEDYHQSISRFSERTFTCTGPTGSLCISVWRLIFSKIFSRLRKWCPHRGRVWGASASILGTASMTAAAVVMTQPDLVRSTRSLPSSYTCPASAGQNILLNHIWRFSVVDTQSYWCSSLKKNYHAKPHRANYHLQSIIHYIIKQKDKKLEGCHHQRMKSTKTKITESFPTLPKLWFKSGWLIFP